MSIILFIIILTALVFVHELGHFIAAKRAGVRVDEFGIGFPPRIFSKKVGETIYSINLFPIGGFVKIFGENPDQESLHGKDAPRSITQKPRLIQAWIMSAGVVFNLLFAWLLLSIGFMFGLPYSADDERYGSRVEGAMLTITQVIPESPAMEAGIKSGDEILALYGEGDALENPRPGTTKDFIASHEEITLAYLRDKEIRTVILHPEESAVSGKRVIGIVMDMSGQLTLPVHQALYAGVFATASMTEATAVGLFDFFKNLFTGDANFSDVAGPVGIANIVGDASVLGFTHVLMLSAIISINLALINLLPFPALDGGRIFVLLIEAVKRSPIKPEVINVVHGIGFILLILLMVVVTYHDVIKLIRP